MVLRYHEVLIEKQQSLRLGQLLALGGGCQLYEGVLNATDWNVDPALCVTLVTCLSFRYFPGKWE